jgi:RsiW-degrading membrane proteinase PrsW (M82 family)
MFEKIGATLIAIIVLAFFLPLGSAWFRAKKDGKRLIPLPFAIVMFTGGTIFYLWIVLSVLIPILRR